MAGAYEICNRFIDCLYKIDYANVKRLCHPACTEQACTWKNELKEKLYAKELLTLLFEKNWLPETIKAVDSQRHLVKKHVERVKLIRAKN